MYFYAIVNLLGIVVALFFGIYVYTRDSYNRLNRLFFVYTLVYVYTGLSEFLRLTAVDESWAFVFHKASFLWPFLPVIFLKFVLVLSENKLSSNKILTVILYSLAASLSLIHVFTQLFYSGIVHHWYGWDAGKQENPFSLIVFVFFISTISLSLFYALQFLLGPKLISIKKQYSLMFIGISLPIFSGFLRNGILQIFGYYFPQVESLAFLIGAVLVFLGIIRSGVFVPNPLETISKVFETISDYLIVFNSNKNILSVSHSVIENTGFFEEDIIGNKLERVVYGSDFLPLKTIPYVIGKEMELSVRTQNAGFIPVSASVSLIRSDSAGTSLFLLLGKDLRERKLFEEELLSARNELEEKVKIRTAELAAANTELKDQVTERLSAENKYKNIFDFAPVGIVQSRAEGTVILCNITFASMLGYNSIDEILNVNMNDIYFDINDRKNVFKSLETKSPGTGHELKFKRKDGSFIWVQFSLFQVKNEQDIPVYYESFVSDITANKNTGIRLLRSEARYRSLIENINEVFYITNADGRTVYISPNVFSFSGYSADHFIGKRSFMLTYKEDFKFLFNFYKKKSDDGTIDATVEFRAIKKDGTVYWAEQITRFVRDEKGKILEFRNVVRDITLRKKAEQELEEYRYHLENLVKERTKKLDDLNILLNKEIDKLRKSEEINLNHLFFLETLIDTIPSPVFFTDTSKRYTGCNKACELFYGVKKEDLIGGTVFDFTPAAEARAIDEKDNELLANPGEQKYQTVISDHKGEEFIALVHKATFKKVDGSVGGIVGIIIDITEIKKLEMEILNTLNKEKELNQLKSGFISSVSHEFRTPLTSILAAADLLEMYGRQWPELKYNQFIGNIQTAVDHLTDITNDLLTISKSDSGKISFNPARINLHELASVIIENAKLTAPLNITFSFQYISVTDVFNLDAKLIQQIITNLLSNAVKYSPAGGNIELKIDSRGNLLLIYVSDQGIGIPEEDLKHLFVPFFRSRNSVNIQGTGLGLSIVKKSAEIHNGTVSVQSKLNEGSCFIVTINS
jgi:PAS domain S-box-containing protein